MSPAPSRTYVGVSEIDCTENTRNEDFADDKLELYNDPAAPLHTLTLKEGDIVMLTRNVDKKSGLVANVRVRIVQLRDHTVEIALHSDDDAAPPKRFNVCRWRTLFRMSHDADILIARTQFPFRLAYALTFNKAQGQTLQRVLVDLTSNKGIATGDKDLHGGAFAHGHLYVALTRVERSANIAVFVDNAQAEAVSAAHIVHTALLYDTHISGEERNSAARRTAIQQLRPGTRLNARHLRPAGYQGEIRHLYDTVTRDPRRPRFLAHEPHRPIGTHAALLDRLRLIQTRKKRSVTPHDAAPADQRQRDAAEHLVVPCRPPQLGTFAHLRAVLGLSRPAPEPPPPPAAAVTAPTRPSNQDNDTHDDARNYIGTYANLLARLPKRNTTTRGGLQTPTAKRSRQQYVVRSPDGRDLYGEFKEE